MPTIMPARNTVSATINITGRMPSTVNSFSEVRMPMAAMAMDAARASRVVTVMTKPERTVDGVRLVRIPLEADYGGELFESPDPPSLPSA